MPAELPLLIPQPLFPTAGFGPRQWAMAPRGQRCRGGHFHSPLQLPLCGPTPLLEGLPWWLRKMVKNLPAMQETRVRSLGGDDPQEKGMTMHSSIVA